MMSKRPAWYVGVLHRNGSGERREALAWRMGPPPEENPRYAYCIGPFRTKGAALLCADMPYAVVSVEGYERLAARQQSQGDGPSRFNNSHYAHGIIAGAITGKLAEVTMTDTKAETKPEAKSGGRSLPAPQRWGLDGDRVLEKLQGKTVLVRLADGASIAGQLVGYSEYTLTLRCSDTVRLVNKGHMVSIEPSRAVP